MNTSLRTHSCGELTAKHKEQKVTLCGWVDTVRDHGGVTFLDLRDRYGKTQIVGSRTLEIGGAVPTLPGRFLSEISAETCIKVYGVVRERPKGTENPKLITGQVEVQVSEIQLLGVSAPLPFEVTKSIETNEELRMQHRYLDLRNPAVQKNLFLRHRMYQAIRRTLDEEKFIEVETPILTKSTPEGARDYLVPSRVNQGEFYALPQSPQLFKQILMVSGFDRYFQIAKCFRDEDLRADRQPEFTQLDMEMSFVGEEDIFTMVEKVCQAVFKNVLDQDLKTPFVRLSYQEAMEKYGTDKPDLRVKLEFVDASNVVRRGGFKIFDEVLNQKDGAVLGIRIPNWRDISRKEIDNLTEFVKSEGGSGLAWFKVAGNQTGVFVSSAQAPIDLDSPIAKFFIPVTLQNMVTTFKARAEDLLLLVADQRPKALKILSALRLHVARLKNLIPEKTFHFSWVTEFPLFKWNEEEKRWDSEHHPFTSPNLEDWAKYKMSGELGKIRSSAYDLVLNGSEIASGSIRIFQKELQREIFKIIGLDEKEAENRFGFLLKAFDFGPPPHGGIALGIDRVIAILLRLSSIREVIAFPKNQKAVDPMTQAPSPVDERQLKELGIKIR